MYKRLIDDTESYSSSGPGYYADLEGGSFVMDKNYTPNADDNYGKVKSKKQKKKKSKHHNIGDKVDENEEKFTERVLPKGTPLRESFAYIPKEKKKFWRPEAVALRKVFPICGLMHALCLCTDIMVSGEILMMVVDCVLIWLDFYNYMVLNKIVIFIEVAIHFMIPVIALTHIQRVLADADSTTSEIIFFFIQYFVVYPVIASVMGKRLNLHYQ